VKKLLSSDRILIRFLGLYLISLILLFLSWTVAYYFLPEGLLRGKTLLNSLAGENVASNIMTVFL